VNSSTSLAHRPAGGACAPWCTEHLGGICFSERRRANWSYARLAKLGHGPITGMVRAEDPKTNEHDGFVQLSPSDARDLASVLGALGQRGLCKAIMLTVHEAEALS
jgi:hypothetical protein